MRLNSIELQWFRGAADPVSLDVAGKSAVVYGTNGAGKSSFVDAVEYILNDGKIGHLTHEYSGKKQERGVINTHTPTLKPTNVSIKFANGTAVRVDVKTNGAFTKSGDGTAELRTWEYRRVVLRQDEVAKFVGSAKGDKYSALLPLLGLEPLECAAENVRQLVKYVEKTADIVVKREQLRAATEATRNHFQGPGDVVAKLRKIRSRYLPDTAEQADQLEECRQLTVAISSRVKSLSADARAYVALSDLAAIPIDKAIADVLDAAAALAQSSEALIEERLTVLKHALSYVIKSNATQTIACPACGHDVPADELRAHIEVEQQKLLEAEGLFSRYKSATSRVSDEFSKLKAAYNKEEVSSWAQSRSQGAHLSLKAYLADIDATSLRKDCSAEQIQGMKDHLIPLVAAAAAATRRAPPEATELLLDQATVTAAEAVSLAAGLSRQVDGIDELLGYLVAVEKGVRDQIRVRSDDTIDRISTDIQRMWSILHPDRAIAGVRLSHPEGADKAIDIELIFHGIEQKSPRLTLSEGYRNSLGLCVFLAMARRNATDAPVILDDVIVSLDRNHRGMIVDLLEQEFADRQVIVFTHDREWYIELRQRLGHKDWSFRTLRPYGEPDEGIAWSTKSSTIDDARAFLESSPDVAGNTARKILDTELGPRVESLQVRMPYLHSLRNDHRMAHDFLESLIGATRKAFQIKEANEYVPFLAAVETLKNADKLLVAWGNKASHSFDVVRPEAKKLIDVCEEALAVFDCASCGKAVNKFDDDKGTLQCSCGSLRWRYDRL